MTAAQTLQADEEASTEQCMLLLRLLTIEECARVADIILERADCTKQYGRGENNAAHTIAAAIRSLKDQP